MKIRRPRLQDGFTLVELLIVVVILGVLAAIAIPQFSASTDDSKAAALDATLSNLRTAIELYYQQHGSYPSAVAAGGSFGAIDTEAAFVSQLVKFTSAAGAVSNTKDATYKYGPYLKKSTIPADPIKNVATVEVINLGSLGMTATSGDPGGWKFDNKTGQLIVNIAAYQSR
ncbi:prepilin-type N-terminal cleavage/methylation domain-containing protein [Zoogloea sp. 1C4]|jgi:prepilin-type N-terminal cleavage/methylation domain-containing protein|uniref:prepilin-type N-terminal cleavage/methylation domain-containing protein n=1 Tax=Zoogloea sp. 1C4 TaxID=2570190 RepID=UPI0012921B07|nr:prepilin-type N-terminal cleavage/methylation domain-containing protein [Zoogloea sp. 1C4]